jgi:hypothetical protein
MAWDDGIDPLSLLEPATLGELHKRMVKGLRRLQPVVLAAASVGTGVTQIAHGQRGGIPRWVGVTPQSAVAVGQPQKADATFIYLQAASACVVDIVLVM